MSASLVGSEMCIRDSHQVSQFMDLYRVEAWVLSETKAPATSTYVVGDVLYVFLPSTQEGRKEYAGV
eukprot:9194378-Alexandrium_andersonii.AAC.1